MMLFCKKLLLRFWQATELRRFQILQFIFDDTERFSSIYQLGLIISSRGHFVLVREFTVRLQLFWREFQALLLCMMPALKNWPRR
ncbi:MAG: hypothetical protein BGP04_25020 [Rhizobiales bacterium 62-17]|nr:MAG: hypothetical protein BGP04_25020 [Rhizobiales bacterium 62-17]